MILCEEEDRGAAAAAGAESAAAGETGGGWEAGEDLELPPELVLSALCSVTLFSASLSTNFTLLKTTLICYRFALQEPVPGADDAAGEGFYVVPTRGPSLAQVRFSFWIRFQNLFPHHFTF